MINIFLIFLNFYFFLSINFFVEVFPFEIGKNKLQEKNKLGNQYNHLISIPYLFDNMNHTLNKND